MLHSGSPPRGRVATGSPSNVNLTAFQTPSGLKVKLNSMVPASSEAMKASVSLPFGSKSLTSSTSTSANAHPVAKREVHIVVSL